MCVVNKVQLPTISHSSGNFIVPLVGKWCEIVNVDLCSFERLKILQMWVGLG
jgi:hypothetical protein